MFISRKNLELLRLNYPTGTRIILIEMDDPKAPPAGTLGTVTDVDSLGTIHVLWDDGSTLGVCYGVDHCRKVKK